MPIDWTDCTPVFLVWFSWRESLLNVLFTPWLFSLLVCLFITALVVDLLIRFPWLGRALIVVSAVLLVNTIYSPLATQWLIVWLESHLLPAF